MEMPPSETTRRAWSAERNAEDGCDQDGIERELRRGGNELVQVVRDRVVRQRGLAEVPVSQVLQIDPVAEGQRLVEAVMGLERRHGGRIARGLLPEIRRDGVARDELRQHEHDKRDPDGEQHERGRAAQHEGQEARRGT
jgi:hypothetical protein